MSRLLLLISALTIAFATSAQPTIITKNNISKAWAKGGLLAIMGGQTGTRNWAPGGEKFSLTAAGSLNLWANRTWGRNLWENNLDINYSLVNTQTQGVRKLDDKLDFYSRYSHKLSSSKWSIGAVAALRTQMTNGYDYIQTPAKRISGFFAPAYVTLSPGVQYRPSQQLSVHFGPDVRWIFVTNSPYSLNYQGGVAPDGSTERTLADFYGVDPARKLRLEYGLYFSTLFYKELFKNVDWKTRLDLTSDVSRAIPENIDVYWTNGVYMSVNQWLKVVYSFDLVYDERVRMFGDDGHSTAAQMKSILGLGLAARF
jgi:hypothetical protein